MNRVFVFYAAFKTYFICLSQYGAQTCESFGLLIECLFLNKTLMTPNPFTELLRGALRWVSVTEDFLIWWPLYSKPSDFGQTSTQAATSSTEKPLCTSAAVTAA